MTVEDVLGTWFPAEGNTKGALVLLAELRDAGDEDYAQLSAATRVFNNADPAATRQPRTPSSSPGRATGKPSSSSAASRWECRPNLCVG